MAENDAISMELVQATNSKNDQWKKGPDSIDESDQEKDIEKLMKELQDLKCRMETKDSAHKQSLLQLVHCQKTADELSTLLKNDCHESETCVFELELMMENMNNQLRDTQGQLLELNVVLSAAKEAQLESITQVEELDASLSLEKVKNEYLARHVGELNETITHLKMAAAEEEKEKMVMIAGKEASNGKEQLQFASEQLEMMHYLEKELLDKSELKDVLKQDLRKANALHKSSEKLAFDVLNELNRTKADLDLKKKQNSEQAVCIGLLEEELKELKLELCKAKEEKDQMMKSAEEMGEELKKTGSEIAEAREKENASGIEIALLKSELHKTRSKAIAAEASEERAKAEKSAVYAALHLLAMEAEKAKKEFQQLKETNSIPEESDFSVPVKIPVESSLNPGEATGFKPKTGSVEGENTNPNAQVAISKEGYEIPANKAEQADGVQKPWQESSPESESSKRELEMARSKIAELRARAEQATSRAEVAEKGKAELEEQIKKWKEHKARRKAALAALNDATVSREITETSTSKDMDSFSYGNNNAPKYYQPLSKILNMKF